MSQGQVILASACDAERRLIGHLLTDHGLKVTDLDGESQVLELARSGSVGVIILDTLSWQAEAMSTLAALKQDPQTRSIPVMLFGQPANAQEAADAVRAGAATWCDRNGFAIESFVEKVRALLDGEGTTAPADVAEAGPSPAIPPAPAPAEQLTAAQVQDVLARAGPLEAFEFAITEAITTTAATDDAVDHITGIVQRDPMLTVAVLSRANVHDRADSPTISETRDAVAHLGKKAFYELVQSISPLTFKAASLWDPGHFWVHSVATSRIAVLLSRLLGLGRCAEVGNAGLLHDIGYHVLGNYFPRQYGKLFTAAGGLDSLPLSWEADQIGAHPGDIAATALEQAGLPAILREVVRVHHSPEIASQRLSGSSRLVAMILQVADLLANALFPGDPVLTRLAPVGKGFEAAVRRADLSLDSVVNKARKIVADLITEMAYLFPQSTSRSYYYKHEPLQGVLYHAPGKPCFDLVRVFLEVRSEALVDMGPARNQEQTRTMPLVVNLMHLDGRLARVEMLSSLMALGVMRNRKVVVLIDEAEQELSESFASESCRLIPWPSHPAHWLRWLRAPVATRQTTRLRLAVA